MPISIVIPTFNRDEALCQCIEAILRQTQLPDEVLVIDDGELSDGLVQDTGRKFEGKGVRFRYYRKDHEKERRGLSESKNRAMELVEHDFLMIDDDVFLEPECLEKMCAVFKEIDDPKLIGVGGIITNNRKKGTFERIFNRLFGLESPYGWDVTDVGFQVWDEGVQERTEGFYTHGGLTLYKKELTKDFSFSTFAGGRTGLEDIDYCLQAKQQGFFFIVEPKAKAFHQGSEVARENEFLIGAKESRNRKEIFRKRCKKDLGHNIWFAWSNTGWILRQFLVGHCAKGSGMVKGLFLG